MSLLTTSWHDAQQSVVAPATKVVDDQPPVSAFREEDVEFDQLEEDAGSGSTKVGSSTTTNITPNQKVDSLRGASVDVGGGGGGDGPRIANPRCVRCEKSNSECISGPRISCARCRSMHQSCSLVNRTEDGKVEDEILKLVGHTDKPRNIALKKTRPRSPGRPINGSAVYEALRRAPPNINTDSGVHSNPHSLRDSPVTPLSGTSSDSGNEDAEGVRDEELLGTATGGPVVPPPVESSNSTTNPNTSTETINGTNGVKALGKRKAEISSSSWVDDPARKYKKARHTADHLSRRISNDQYHLLVALRKSNQAAKLYSEAVEELVAYIQEHIG